MTSTVKKAAEAFETLDHSMTRITVIADGSFDEFQARFDATMPASTAQDVIREVKDWRQAVALVEAKAPFGLLIYRKVDVHSVMKLAGHTPQSASYPIGKLPGAQPPLRIHPPG